VRRNVIDDQLIDDVVNTYVDWREQSERVWRAYHDWSTSVSPDAALRFAAYVAELDREHRASDAYADAVTRAAGCGRTSALPSASQLDELFRPA
jgi:hypothetical protein